MLRAEILAINAEAAALCEGLTGNQLGSRPDPAKWSISENLTHLCVTTEVFLPAVDRAITETRDRGLQDSGPFRLGWYGRLLVRYVQPPPLIRLPAPKALLPRLAGAPEQALEKFLMAQNAMAERMEAATDLNLTELRFPSPLARYIRMNLLEFFSVFNGHSRRHLWQGANVRHALFAGD